MTTAPLSKEIEDVINNELEKYGFQVPYDGSNNFYDEDAIKHYKAGATSLATRAQPLVEALEAWQNFDSRIHNSGDVALLHMKAHKALTEYNQQP